MKKSLYSRGAPDVRTRRKLRFNDTAPNIQTSWEEPVQEPVHPVLNQHYEDHSMSYLKKILLGSTLFCVIALGIGAYIFFNGANLISANNIDISINGPVSIAGGSSVPFEIVVTNRNNVDLVSADLAVDFPAGTTDPNDSTKELKTYRELIGDMPAGSSADKTVHAIMFGEENLQKSISVTVTYKVKGSNSLFTKTKTYDVLINSSPIGLTVESFKEVSSGQEFDLTVNLKSNSQEILKSIVLKMQYPFGFSFISSSLKPLNDNATWKIGDIPPGALRKIVIHGKLTGEDNEARVFRLAAGAQSSSDAGVIGTQYVATEQDVTVQKPFISLSMTINGEPVNAEYVGRFGQDDSVEINWSNNLPVSVSNLVITAKLSGSAYDRSNVQPQQGYWKSATNEVVWNQQTNQELKMIGAGAQGSVSFRLTPKDFGGSVRAVVNPEINIAVNVSGNRTQETGVSSNLSSALSRTIRVASSVSLSGRVVRSIGPFANTGPIPPKADQASTFTIVWNVDNTSNAVGNAQVTTTLPPQVKWLNAFSPNNENITYDPNSGKVTWQVGNVGTYTLNSMRRREVSFQVSVTPSINQIGQPVTLVNQATLTATDSFTGVALESSQGALTSRFSTDPNYKDGDGNVVK